MDGEKEKCNMVGLRLKTLKLREEAEGSWNKAKVIPSAIKEHHIKDLVAESGGWQY